MDLYEYGFAAGSGFLAGLGLIYHLDRLDGFVQAFGRSLCYHGL